MNECLADVDANWSRMYRAAQLMVPQEPDFNFSSIDISGMSVLEVIVPNDVVSAEGMFVLFLLTVEHFKSCKLH